MKLGKRKDKNGIPTRNSRRRAQTALNFDSAAKELWGSCFPELGVVTITVWTAYLDRVSK